MGLNFNSNFQGMIPGNQSQLFVVPTANTFGNLPQMPGQPQVSPDAFTPAQSFLPSGSNGLGQQQGGMFAQVLLPLLQSILGMMSMMMPATNSQSFSPQQPYQGYSGQPMPNSNPGFLGGETQPPVGQPATPAPYMAPQAPGQQPPAPMPYENPTNFGGGQPAVGQPMPPAPYMPPQAPEQQVPESLPYESPTGMQPPVGQPETIPSQYPQNPPGMSPEEIYEQGYKDGYIDGIQDPLEPATPTEQAPVLTDGEKRATEHVNILANNPAAMDAIVKAGGEEGLLNKKGLKAIAEADVKGDDKVWGDVKKEDRQGIQDATRILLGYNNETEASEAFDYALGANGAPDSMDMDEVAEYSGLYQASEENPAKPGNEENAENTGNLESAGYAEVKNGKLDAKATAKNVIEDTKGIIGGQSDGNDSLSEKEISTAIASVERNKDTVDNADAKLNILNNLQSNFKTYSKDGQITEDSLAKSIDDVDGNAGAEKPEKTEKKDGTKSPKDTEIMSEEEQNKPENLYGSTPIGLGQGEDEGLFLYHPGGDPSKTAYARALGADVTVDGAPVYEIPGSGKRFTYNDAEREMVFVDKADQAKHEGALSKVSDQTNKENMTDEKISNVMNDNQNAFEEGVLDADDENTEMVTLADWKAWANPETNERMNSVQTDANVRSEMRVASQKVLDRIDKAKDMEPEAALLYLGHYKKEFAGGDTTTWKDLQDVASGKNLLTGVPEDRRENLRMAAAKILYEQITPGHDGKNDDQFGGKHKIDQKNERYGKTDYATIFNYLDNRDSNGGVGGGTNGDGKVDRDMFGRDSLSSTKDLSDDRKKFWGIDW